MKPTTYIHQVFGEGGTLAKGGGRYKPRPEQIGLSGQIALSLIKGDELFVSEAPCGTGKTFAYLVPLLYHFVQTGSPILISTAGIALQQQLIEKDLPFLRDHVFPDMVPEGTMPFSFHLLKGISNYVCLKKKTNAGPLLLVPASKDFTLWLQSTPTGDREEAPQHTDEHWSLVSIPSDECNANTCPRRAECFYLKQRGRAMKADILVMNHHLLAGVAKSPTHPFLTASVTLPPTRGQILRRRLVVLDEAHEYPGIARQVSGFSFRPDVLLRKMPYDASAGDVAEQSRQEAMSLLRALVQQEGDHVLTPERAALLASNFRDIKLHYNRYKAGCETEGQTLIRTLEQSEADPVYMRLSGYESKAQNLNGVCVRNEKGVVTFHGVVTQAQLPPGPLFALSATLRYDGKYDNWCASVGAKPTRTYTTPSPFLWSDQALIVLPSDAEDPSVDRIRYQSYLAEKSRQVVLSAKGRTLILCSSWTHVHAVAEALRPTDYTVLTQGTMGKQELIERFKSDTESVLVGTTSLWTGVDVPGEALSALIIDKLPFRTHDDPNTAILKLQDPKNFFAHHVLPETVSLFAQGFGRLIRSVQDRGVAVILDRRIQTQRYGSLFYAALPRDAQYTTDTSRIGPFLAQRLPLPLRGPGEMYAIEPEE